MSDLEILGLLIAFGLSSWALVLLCGWLEGGQG
jgi:hypothetical protein